ncbi:MAG: hypothetical protein J5582_16085 [Ruminococcus sp.]|uniref:hypothetical protein n=1 Tax=Ruminococcus sp. TaxID=41978 RepID=UPI0025F870F4|nr:hypothetical protein [Ruminococcus sp.]MBO4868060.1 hypothetical protein [Ruminococcus sp.]
MKKPNMAATAVLFFIFGILVPAVLLWVVTFGMDESREYKENGIKVSCTVIGTSVTGSSSRPKVKYKSPDGDWIEADCIANGKVMMGQKIEGYVMPDDPKNVYCPPDMALKMVFYALAAAAFIGGGVALFKGLKDRRKYNILIKNGVPCKAQLTSWHKNDSGLMNIQLRVFRRNGEEEIINVEALKGTPIVGEYYDILMSEDDKGRVTAALNDERLSI